MNLIISLSSEGVDCSLVKKEGKKLVYRGETFDGYNKPKKNTGKGTHKQIVLAKKGDKCKLIRFGKKGYSDYTKHKDKERRARYHARHKAILLKDGTPAYKDKFQAAYWSMKVLW
jgi:hypothetical protein